MLVTVLSARGAPGVSSWALTLATAWPSVGDRVLVEADCSGGVFGARYDVAIEPGAADLVSTARRGRFDDDLELSRFSRQVKSGDDQGSSLWVVPEPLSSHEALDVWRAMALPTAEAMLSDSRLWIADCGRVWHRSPTESLLAIAPLSIVVSDSSMPSLLVLKARIESLPNRTAIVVIGETQYSTDDLLAFTGAEYVWNVPHVRRLEALAAEFSSSSRARRSKIWRTALNISHTLSADLNSLDRPAVGSIGDPASTSLDGSPTIDPLVTASTPIEPVGPPPDSLTNASSDPGPMVDDAAGEQVMDEDGAAENVMVGDVAADLDRDDGSEPEASDSDRAEVGR